MTAGYQFTDRAQAEMLGIYLYGIGEFGPAQAGKYLDSLEHCFEILADHPQLGRSAPKLGVGVRRHEHASHVILYRTETDHILILAVVHGRSVHDLPL